MAAAEVMDGEIVRQWFRLAADALHEARLEIDALNVFPVPDADTGTNLHQTIACVALAVAALPPEASSAEVWRAAASAALLGACGNSGIIVSQMLRGLAETCGPASPCDGQVLAAALMNAAMLGRAAVQRPAEGTVLTVADAAALAASQMTSLAEVTREAAVGARRALAATQQQLAVLAVSGVVDAGAAGLCVLLDALSAAISGTAPGGYAVPAPAAGHGTGNASQPASPPAALAGNCYEVTYLLDAAAPQVATLRSQLDQLGDSLVVSGGDGQWHVHVHVADAGAAIEAGLTAGGVSRITVTHLPAPGSAGQAPALAAGAATSRAVTPGDQPGPAVSGDVVVTGAEGAGLIELLRAAGANVVGAARGQAAGSGPGHAVRSGRPKIIIRYNESARPDVGPDAGRLAAGGVTVAPPTASPASAGRRAVAGLTAEGPVAVGPGPVVAGPATGLPVSGEQVIEISSPVQALAALAVHDPGRDSRDDAAAMLRAVAGMRHASVVRCPARAATGADRAAGPGGHIFVGQIAGQEMASGQDQAAVALAVIDRLLAPGAELVTLLSGREASPALIEEAAAHVRRLVSAAEVVCYDGGMASAVLLIGAE